MTLPASGAISFNNINVELGVAGTTQASLGQASYRTLAGVASGAISMSNFWGKANQFNLTISTNQTNADLRTLAVNAGWDQSSKVVATISSGVVVSANSTASTGLTISGSFPGGVELINNGYILGMGGAGGWGGGSTQNYPYTNYGQSGFAGGKALAVTVSVTITNNNTIGGGGGGGGGGGMAADNQKFQTYVSGSGGGGGRSGSTNSAYGQAPAFGARGNNGTAGTFSSIGYGGASVSAGTVAVGGAGGNGGGWGANGTGGSAGGGTGGGWGGSSGGSAGACLTGNVYITWAATGSRYGAIS